MSRPMAGFRQRLRGQAERMAERFGWRLARLTAEERRYLRPSHATGDPSGVPELHAGNPRLHELRKRYAALNLPVTTRSLWTDRLLHDDLDLRHFRGDNPYVWQYRRVKSHAALKYYLHLRYVEERDRMGLLDRLQEDGSFGCWTFDYARRKMVSRDLLDSINEINFLERQLGLSSRTGLRVVDIGAGYGRLAHRACEALPQLDTYYCLDAIPESTFLCERYLAYRGCDRAVTVPLDEVETRMRDVSPDLAVNIHSFSECTFGAVQWWLRWLAQREVPNLLIVPNDPDALLSTEPDGSRRDFSRVLEETGYRLAHSEPVVDDADMRGLTDISSRFFLFRLESAKA